MLIYLIDRVWSVTVLYIALCAGIWTLWPSTSPLLLKCLLGGVTAYWSSRVVDAVLKERRCAALGDRAPSMRTWTPFNLGVVVKNLRESNQDRQHRWWEWAIGFNRNRHHPWTVEFIVLGERVLTTVDEENIKAVLATQFADFGKGAHFRQQWKDFLGLSIFTTDGDMWHSSRSLLRAQFVKDRISDLHTFEKNVQILLPMLAGADGSMSGTATQDGATVQLDNLFYRFTLDAATEFLFGESVDSLHNGEAEFAAAFSTVQRVQATIARAGPAEALVPRRAFYAGLTVLNRFVGRYIDRALALSPEELAARTKTDDGYTFLHALAGHTRDRAVLRDQLVATLLAGRDTTATSLSWLFWELARHPAVVAKLRAEILSTVGPEREPTYFDLKDMRYLQHTLNETLRLYPVVPFNVRVALRDTTLPRGGGPDGRAPVAVPKGTPIGYSPFILQRRADIYAGNDDEKKAENNVSHLAFSPERWATWTPRPWTYIPFNGGPRLCIGQNFALTEMAYVVVRVLQTYARIESREQEFPGFKSDIVLAPAKGVRVAFFRQ